MKGFCKTLLFALLLVWPRATGAQLSGPVTVSALDASGTCATANACASFALGTNVSVTLDVNGTFTGTLSFEGTVDGTNWKAVALTNLATGVMATSTTTTGSFGFSNLGVATLRARATAWTSGSASIYLRKGYASAMWIGGPPYGNEVINDGAIAYWRLDETSGTTAASAVGSFPGTITGGVTLNQGGVAGGKAMAFNGVDGKILTTSVPILTPFTIEGWVKVPASKPAVSLVSTRETFPAVDSVFLRTQATNAIPTITLDYASTSSPQQNLSSSVGPVTTDTWHQLVAVVTSLNATLYVDAVQVGALTLPAPFTGSTVPVAMNQDRFGGFGGGLIDELAIYNKALTPTQIAKHYQVGLPRTYRDTVLTDGPTVYWRLGEPSGTTAASEVGTGLNGTISGGVTLGQPGAMPDGNTAMTFNGTTGKITTAAIANTAAMTVEAWVNTLVSAQEPVLSTRTTPSSGGFFYFGINGADRVFIFCDNSTPPSLTPNVTGTRLNDGRWHHIAATMDGTTTRLYTDGVLEIQGEQTHAAGSGIGGIGFEGTSFFNGSIDDVALYPVALTTQQVAAHYNAGRRRVSRVTTMFWHPAATAPQFFELPSPREDRTAA